MTIEHLIKDFEAYIATQCRLAEESKEKKLQTTDRPFVTLSRQTGAGGFTVAQKLIEFLKAEHKTDCPWMVFDRNLVDKVLEEHHLPHFVAKYMPEDKISAIRALIEEISGHPSDLKLIHQTNETILHLAHMGNSILVGRGAYILTRKLPRGTHIRLISSLDNRIQHIMEYYGYDHVKAKEYIQKEDGGRKKYLQQYFNRDINDALLYDLVINTDDVSYDDAARMIADIVLRRQKCLNSA